MFELLTWPRNPWSIFDELESLHEDMTQAIEGSGGRRLRRRYRPEFPLMNVWSNPDGMVIDAELPGVNPEDVDVSVVGDELTLQGKVNATEPKEGETAYRRERPSGEFVRTLRLPFRADTGAVKAAYKNGILRVTVPRSEEEKPKKIAVEAA
jgi:HSP20 family protein